SSRRLSALQRLDMLLRGEQLLAHLGHLELMGEPHIVARELVELVDEIQVEESQGAQQNPGDRALAEEDEDAEQEEEGIPDIARHLVLDGHESGSRRDKL